MDNGKRFIFFDLETSGLGKTPFGESLPDASGVGLYDADQILSAYFIVVDESGREIERMAVNMGGRGDVVPKPDAIMANRIFPIGRRGLSESDAAEKIRALLVRHGGRNAVLGGHNAESFDVPRLRSLLTRNGIDKDVIPGDVVDTMFEAQRAWVRENAPENGRELDFSSQQDSMRLALACRRHGVDFEDDKAHDARYDVERTVSLWKALGRATSSKKSDADHPYQLERHKGKRVKLNVLDHGKYRERRLTVVGCGTGAIPTEMGTKHMTSTFLIDEESVPEDFAGTLKDFVKSKATLVRGGSEADEERAASLYEEARAKLTVILSKKGVIVERTFNSARQTYAAADEIEGTSLYDLQHVGGVSPADELAALVDTIHVNPKILEEQRKQSDIYQGYAQLFEDVVLELLPGDEVTMENPVTPVISGENNVIPELAQRLSELSEYQRRQFMVYIMDDQGLGWAGNMLGMAEKYGVRHGMPGFETKRLDILKSQLPAAWPQASVTVRVDDLFPGAREQKTLKSSGASSFDFTADGRSLHVALNYEDGSSLMAEIPYPEAPMKSSGLFEGLTMKRPLSIDHIQSELSLRFPDLNSTGARTIAQSIRGTIIDAVGPDRSYESYKELLLARKSLEESKSAEERDAALIAILGETISVLGDDYSSFARNANSQPFMDLSEHDGLYGEQVPGMPSEDESMLLAYDDVRAEFLQVHGKVLLPSVSGVPHENEASNEAPPAVAAGSAVYSLNPAPSYQCKICSRDIKSRRSVAGIGPKCAQKLRHFIERPMVVATAATAERQIADIESSYKTNGDARKYPIMLVRTNEETFVADVVEKKADGSFLMINLSRLAKKAGTKKDYKKQSSYKTAADKSFFQDLGLVVTDGNVKILKVFGEE